MRPEILLGGVPVAPKGLEPALSFRWMMQKLLCVGEYADVVGVHGVAAEVKQQNVPSLLRPGLTVCRLLWRCRRKGE